MFAILVHQRNFIDNVISHVLTAGEFQGQKEKLLQEMSKSLNMKSFIKAIDCFRAIYVFTHIQHALYSFVFPCRLLEEKNPVPLILNWASLAMQCRFAVCSFLTVRIALHKA